MRPGLSTLLLLIFSATTAIAADYSDKDVVGQWYRGDHFGYNVVLTVAPDHTYKATWTGDQIDPKTNRPAAYGSARGTWKLDGDRLVISPVKETKDIKGDLSTMRLQRRRGKVVLAPFRPLPVPTIFHLDPMMVFERQSR